MNTKTNTKDFDKEMQRRKKVVAQKEQEKQDSRLDLSEVEDLIPARCLSKLER